MPSSENDSLTKEQKEILESVFQYTDKFEITDKEKLVIREMFDTPEKFALLRKILGVLTRDERGLTMPSAEANLSADDYESLGRELELSRRVDERIRGALVNLYRLTRQDIVAEKTKEFEETNRKAEEEKEKTKEYEEQQDVDKRVAGENL